MQPRLLRRWGIAYGGLILLAAVAGCTNLTGFKCTNDVQCGSTGRCEANGACTFPDHLCAMGRRYGAHSAENVAGRCLGSEPPFDGGIDGFRDAPVDAPLDAAVDAVGDAPVDARVDGPTDAPVDGTSDAPIDAMPDAPPACTVSLPIAAQNMSQGTGAACTVDGILNPSGTPTGLDYTGSSLGSFDGRPVTGCVAGEFATQLTAGTTITIRAAQKGNACSYPCTACSVPAGLLIFYGTNSNPATFNFLEAFTPNATFADYSATLPEGGARYIILCRSGAGSGAQDVAVISLRACQPN